VSTIIHLHLQDAIEFHPALHGFLQGRGTGTCILEAKLQMQLAFYTWQPLYQIFIDLSKAYDTDNFRMNTCMVDTAPLIIWLLYFALMMNFCVFE
jgi:hypothetical protein